MIEIGQMKKGSEPTGRIIYTRTYIAISRYSGMKIEGIRYIIIIRGGKFFICSDFLNVQQFVLPEPKQDFVRYVT